MPTPTPTEQRLDRLEAAVLELSRALRQTVGWRHQLHPAPHVSELHENAASGIETRPHQAPERRTAA
jgi:hypothetical protein